MKRDITLTSNVKQRRDLTCIVVLCNNRPKMLDMTLKSLLSARGVGERGLVIVSQSGNHKQTTDLLETNYGFLERIRNVEVLNDKRVDNKIANHFKWTFERVFEYPECNEGVIVIEDDLELSPDFLEYFELTIPVVENDDTLITASLWNDIGYINNSKDKARILRTNYFPGLGWWLSKKVWDDLLKDDWPTREWDWYVRAVANKNKLDSLIPEVPRDYHVANSGTYMRKAFFDRHFKNININRDSEFRWSKRAVEFLSPSKTYKEYIMSVIDDANQINTIDAAEYGRVNIMWIEGLGKIEKKRLGGRRCKKFFEVTGIWFDEQVRADWRGIKQIWYEPTNSHLLIIDCDSEWWWRRWPVTRVFHDMEICDDFN